MEPTDQREPSRAAVYLAMATVLSCAFTLVAASLTDGWISCEFYFWPSLPAFGNDPGPFGWERIRRDFPWNPRERPWLVADLIAMLGIYAAISLRAGRIKWWPLILMTMLFFAYSACGIHARIVESLMPYNVIWDVASFINVFLLCVTLIVARDRKASYTGSDLGFERSLSKPAAQSS